MARGGLKFLADENISRTLVQVLTKLGPGCLVESIHSKPEQGHPDEEWIPVYTERGYIILTPDRKQLREEVVARVLVDTSARVVFLPKRFADSKRWDQALWLLRHWPKILERSRRMRGGHLVSVHWNGAFSSVRPDFEGKRRRSKAKATKQKPKQFPLEGLFSE